MEVRGRTVLITGGGSGIGRGLAEALHGLGNDVVIAGRSRVKLDETIGANPGMEAMTVDIQDAADIVRFAAEAVERFPTLDVLVNNAGIMQIEDMLDHDLGVAEATVATNLLGPIRLTAALLPHLVSRPRAAVVNVTSGLAFVPLAVSPTYSATKAALHSYTISLREQLRDTGVEVIEIAPPYVQTRLTGEHQAVDPRAMPLEDYVADTMEILARDGAREVVIERVARQRYAEARGEFDEVLAQLSAMGRERSAANRGG